MDSLETRYAHKHVAGIGDVEHRGLVSSASCRMKEVINKTKSVAMWWYLRNPERRKKAKACMPYSAPVSYSLETPFHHHIMRESQLLLSLCKGLTTLDPFVPVLDLEVVPLRLGISLPASPVCDRLPELIVVVLAFQTSSLALRC
jgi:hypothetical protein